MEIRPAEKQRLLEVLYIIRECSRQLLEKGVKYWNNSHADYNDISDDIDKQYVYLMFSDLVAVGTITIKPDKKDPKITTISRLAIFPAHQKKGFAHEILKFAEETARKNGSTKLVGTTPTDDKILFQLLVENGFINTGVVNEVPEEFVQIRFEKKI